MSCNGSARARSLTHATRLLARDDPCSMKRPKCSGSSSARRMEATEMQTTRSLEERIQAIEDRLEIYNLIASHPPSADTGGSEHILASWVEDGVFDRGENLSSPRGRASIAEQVLTPVHQGCDRRRTGPFHRPAACRDLR